jgi:hypothetical protein
MVRDGEKLWDDTSGIYTLPWGDGHGLSDRSQSIIQTPHSPSHTADRRDTLLNQTQAVVPVMTFRKLCNI